MYDGRRVPYETYKRLQEATVEVSEQLSGLDLASALARVGGDEELLREIAGIFLEQCPEALREVNRAIETADGEALEHAAHSLKGSVGNFGAKDAYDAALRLELAGRHREFGRTGEALSDLERALDTLNPQLTKLTTG